MSKKCCNCQTIKDEKDFSLCSRNKDGLQDFCKLCNSVYQKKYAHSDKRKEYLKTYRNSDKAKKYRKKYKQINKERIREASKKYREDNLEKIKCNSQKYYQDNRERILKHQRDYEQKNPEVIRNRRKGYENNELYKLAGNIRAFLNYMLKNVGSSKQNRKSETLLGYSVEELQQHLEAYKHQLCQMCLNTIITDNPKNYQIDHIIPSGSALSEKEVIELNQFKNLRLICKSCNIKKSKEDKKFIAKIRKDVIQKCV